MPHLSIDLTEPGARAAGRLIAEILAFARARGIDQTTLAARAGISAESLSRLKRVGGCRLATALELSRVAGFTRLELTARPASRAAASLAARKLSGGRRLPIAADELVSALRSGKPREGHYGHLLGFFEELPVELVHDVILDEDLDVAELARLARALGAEGEIVDWLAEMAGDGVADAA